MSKRPTPRMSGLTGVSPIAPPTAAPEPSALPVLSVAPPPDEAPTRPAKTAAAVQSASTTSTAASRNNVNLNMEVDVEVGELIDYVKFKTKLSKKAIVEQAVLAHWAKYKSH